VRLIKQLTIFGFMSMSGFLGCVEIESNPDDEKDEETEDETDEETESENETLTDTSTSTSTETETQEDVSLSIDSILAFGGISVKNAFEVGNPINFEAGPSTGTYYILLSTDAWDGWEDQDNACLIVFDLTSDAATLDETFVGDGKWAGWTFSGADTYSGSWPACENLDDQSYAVFEQLASADFGIGYGELSTEDVGEGQTYAEYLQETMEGWEYNWTDDIAPYVFSQYINLDFGDFGGSTGWSAINYAYAYEVNDEDVIATETITDADGVEETVDVKVDMSNAAYLPDGYVSGNPFFGWGFN
jgi:hypothetical protein